MSLEKIANNARLETTGKEPNEYRTETYNVFAEQYLENPELPDEKYGVRNNITPTLSTIKGIPCVDDTDP